MTFTQILEDIDFLCQTNSTSYPVADKTRNVNRHYYIAEMEAFKARHDFDDSNQSGIPTTTESLSEGDGIYSFPATALKLREITVLDLAGNAQSLQRIDLDDVPGAWSEFESTNGMPRYYRVIGRQIELKPYPTATSVTLTNGLTWHYLRELDEFATSDTTQEPGLDEPFHRILSIGGAIDWFLVHDQSKVPGLQDKYNDLIRQLQEHYGSRDLNLKTRITPAHNVRHYI